jgi:hypothetical protein
VNTTSRTGRPLTLPRGIHGNGSHLTDREAGRAEHAPKLSSPPWRILVNNNTPCFARKTAPVSARKPSVFAGGKHRTPGTIAEKPMFPGQGGGSRYSHDSRESARVPACMDILRKTFFSGDDTTVVLFGTIRGPGAVCRGPPETLQSAITPPKSPARKLCNSVSGRVETPGAGGPKSWGRWLVKPHTNRAEKFRAKVSVFSLGPSGGIIPEYHTQAAAVLGQFCLHACNLGVGAAALTGPFC